MPLVDKRLTFGGTRTTTVSGRRRKNRQGILASTFMRVDAVNRWAGIKGCQVIKGGWEAAVKSFMQSMKDDQ